MYLCWTPLVCTQQYLVLCGRGEMCNLAQSSIQKARKLSFNCTVYFNGLLFFFWCWEVSIVLWGNLSFFLFWQCTVSKTVFCAFSPILKKQIFSHYYQISCQQLLALLLFICALCKLKIKIMEVGGGSSTGCCLRYVGIRLHTVAKILKGMCPHWGLTVCQI